MREDIKVILTEFLTQVQNGGHSTYNYPPFYSGLQLKIGFGIGKDAKIPWITFLGEGQTPQNGIFPVYYFFKEHHKLILAYGISEAEIPKRNWFVPPSTKTIKQYFDGLRITPYKYHKSYVYEVYGTFKELDWNKIESDLYRLINRYKKIMQLK